MRQFNALLKKDFFVFRKGLMIPIWLICGAYLVTILLSFYALFKGHTNIQISGIPVSFLKNAELQGFISFGMQMGMYMSFIGLIVTISMIILSSLLLNSDVKHKCELFHRSQPVSVWKITASRYIIGIGGMVILSLLAGIFNMIVTNITVSFISPFKIDWWFSLNGMLLSWAHLAIALLVLGSLCFVLSAIFRDNAFGKGILGLAVIEIIIKTVNGFLNVGIPSLFEALLILIMSGISKLQQAIGVMKFGNFQFSTHAQNTIPDFSSFAIPKDFLVNLWSTFCTWETVFKLLFCAVMYVLATCIYHRREVQF